VRFAPNDQSLAARRDFLVVVVVVVTSGFRGRSSRRIGNGDSLGRPRPSQLPSWHVATHELTNKILQKLPDIETPLPPYEIVSDAGEGKEVNPEGVRPCLLEASREET
jgi:hypothetical protein